MHDRHDVGEAVNVYFKMEVIRLEEIDLFFEWDEAKDAINEELHGINFDYAMQVWSDPNSVTVPAKQTKGDLRRYMIIGRAFGGYWSVIHTMPDKKVRRIISARPSNHRERSAYDRHLNG